MKAQVMPNRSGYPLVVIGLTIGLSFGLCGCDRKANNSAGGTAAPRIEPGGSANAGAQRALAEAEQLMARGDLEGAWKLIQQRLVERPNDPQTVMMAADLLSRRKEWLEAAKLLDGLRGLPPPQAVSVLGQAAEWYARGEDTQNAERCYRNLIQAMPESARVQAGLVEVLRAEGREYEATKLVEQLVRSPDATPAALFFLVGGDVAANETSITASEKQQQIKRTDLGKARKMFREGQLREAAELTAKVCEQYPDWPTSSALHGLLLASLQDSQQFTNWLQHVPTGASEEPDYWNALGLMLMGADQPLPAARCFAESVLRLANQPWTYRQLSQALLATEQLEPAAKVVARAEQLEQCHKLAIRQDLNKLEPSVTTEICQRLEALQRPWEAWAWRTLSAKRRGTVQADFAALKQARDQLLASYQPPAETFLLCGIDRQALPLPDQAKISLHNSAPEQANKAPAGEVRLVDRAKAIGLEFQYDGSDDLSDTKFYTHQVSGGGIGAFDYDLDGWCDLYFGQGGGDAHDPQGSKPNPLFRNLDGERFVQVPELVGVGDRGYGQGIAAGDFNQDGFADLLVANIGPCKLLLNQGDGTFRDVTEEIGLRTDAWTTSAAMADLDGDRLVDIVLINYLDDPTIFKLPCQHTNLVCRPQNYHEATNLFFQGQRELQVSPWAGINPNPPTPSIGFAAVVTNIDGRDGNDIYSADDGRPNQYWISEVDPEQAGRYRLREQANMRGCATGPQGELFGGMGIAFGDFDRNGRFDLHVTNFLHQPVSLYMQTEQGLFRNQTAKYGLYESSYEVLGFGTQATDLDHDGWLDLVVLNGHVYDGKPFGLPYKMLPQIFMGGQKGFRLMSPESLGGFWQQETLGRTLAIFDWNRDGRMDVVGNHLDVPAVVLENQSSGGGHYVAIELVGVESERDATGAKVIVHCGEVQWSGWATAGDGYMCTNESLIHIGIGNQTHIDRVEVQWPSGKRDTWQDLDVDARYLLIEGAESVVPRLK